MDKVKKIIKRVFDKLDCKKTTVIFVLTSIVLCFLISGYEDYKLSSIAVSPDGEFVAYCSFGYHINQSLTLSKYNGTQLFKYEFAPEQDAGGVALVWFEENMICVYAVRTQIVMLFSYDGTILNSTELNDFEYPNRMEGFKKTFTTAYYTTSNGIYKYKNYDFISSFIFKKTRELTFTDNSGIEFIIWEGG